MKAIRTFFFLFLLAPMAVYSVQAGTRFPLATGPAEDIQPSLTGTSGDPLELIIRPGKLQIRWNESFPSGEVFLYDLLGNKLLCSRANEAIEWNLENFRTGVYFVVWKDGRRAFTKKFLYRQD